MKKKFLTFTGVGLTILVIIIGGGFAVWAGNAAEPQPQALESLQATSQVNFEKVNQWLVFTPSQSEPTTGLILYPGGRVDYRAYAPLAQAIASGGVRVIVVSMPLNMAFFGIDQAADVMKAYPGIATWAIGGHSLGGAMAAQFAGKHTSLVSGLVLWASYPAGSNDLSNKDLAVISIYADKDGLATLQDIETSKTRLPADTIFVMIPGGNHAQFGAYGAQTGDGEAEISQTEQQTIIVENTLAFLQSLAN